MNVVSGRQSGRAGEARRHMRLPTKQLKPYVRQGDRQIARADGGRGRKSESGVLISGRRTYESYLRLARIACTSSSGTSGGTGASGSAKTALPSLMVSS